MKSDHSRVPAHCRRAEPAQRTGARASTSPPLPHVRGVSHCSACVSTSLSSRVRRGSCGRKPGAYVRRPGPCAARADSTRASTPARSTKSILMPALREYFADPHGDRTTVEARDECFRHPGRSPAEARPPVWRRQAHRSRRRTGSPRRRGRSSRRGAFPPRTRFLQGSRHHLAGGAACPLGSPWARRTARSGRRPSGKCPERRSESTRPMLETQLHLRQRYAG
jgi:hypothetical protein